MNKPDFIDVSPSHKKIVQIAVCRSSTRDVDGDISSVESLYALTGDGTLYSRTYGFTDAKWMRVPSPTGSEEVEDY